MTSKSESSEQLFEKERRRVNMVLSTRSCGIEEPFTEDVIDKSEFYIQRKPVKRQKARDIEEIVKERLTYSGPQRSIGGDNSRDEKKKQSEVSREKLLDQRVKKKGDKFCWF